MSRLQPAFSYVVLWLVDGAGESGLVARFEGGGGV